jgi:hypothetical protein
MSSKVAEADQKLTSDQLALCNQLKRNVAHVVEVWLKIVEIPSDDRES